MARSPNAMCDGIVRSAVLSGNKRLRKKDIRRLTTDCCMNESTNPKRHLPSDHQAVDYQKIFESAPALFLLLGADETFPILDASNGYLRATCTERDEIVGPTVRRLSGFLVVDPIRLRCRDTMFDVRWVLVFYIEFRPCT